MQRELVVGGDQRGVEGRPAHEPEDRLQQRVVHQGVEPVAADPVRRHVPDLAHEVGVRVDGPAAPPELLPEGLVVDLRRARPGAIRRSRSGASAPRRPTGIRAPPGGRVFSFGRAGRSHQAWYPSRPSDAAPLPNVAPGSWPFAPGAARSGYASRPRPAARRSRSRWNQSTYGDASPFSSTWWNGQKPRPVWLKTPSSTIRMPRAWRASTSSRRAGVPPRSGSTAR